jgi:hypothetical protein
LEHLHVYCTSQLLVGAHSFCHQKIENAIFALYDFASMREYGTPLQDTLRISSLQEHMERIASEIELLERPIVQNSHLILRSRDTNKCILSRHSLNTAILLNKIPAEQLYEYDKYPLAHRVGFIHLINENEFDIAAATIVDVGFLGLFPKAILQCLYKYANEMEKINQDKKQYMFLVNDIITAFIYRPIIMEKVIHIMLSKEKNVIEKGRYAEELPNNNTDDSAEYASCNDSITCLDTPDPTMNSPPPATVQHGA